MTVELLPLPGSFVFQRASHFAGSRGSKTTHLPVGPRNAGQCCGGATTNADAIARRIGYSEEEVRAVPAGANLGLGCGNPLSLAGVKAGETVLDLGSGAGFDALLATQVVGPKGRVLGVDMTPEMLARAEANARKAGVGNVEFRRGYIEALPVEDASVDVVISNCVINLAADKDSVLHEAYRVLKPGGRFAVSDVVIRGAMPPAVRRSMELWVGCVAGALSEEDYRRKLEAAGFTDIELETTRVYQLEDARSFLAASGLDVDQLAPLVEGRVTSAFVRARKPVGS